MCEYFLDQRKATHISRSMICGRLANKKHNCTIQVFFSALAHKSRGVTTRLNTSLSSPVELRALQKHPSRSNPYCFAPSPANDGSTTANNGDRSCICLSLQIMNICKKHELTILRPFSFCCQSAVSWSTRFVSSCDTAVKLMSRVNYWS